MEEQKPKICVLCEKPIKVGHEKYISCQDLDFTHGKECNCGLAVGIRCYNKIMKKRKEKKENGQIQ